MAFTSECALLYMIKVQQPILYLYRCKIYLVVSNHPRGEPMAEECLILKEYLQKRKEYFLQ